MTEQDIARLTPQERALREQMRTDPRLAASGTLMIGPEMLRRYYPNAPASWGFSRGDVVLPNDTMARAGGANLGGPGPSSSFGGFNAPSFGTEDLPSGRIGGLGLPVSITSQNVSQPGGGGFMDGLKGWLSNPRNLLSLAALIPAGKTLLSGGGSGSGSASESALLDEARQGMALNRERVTQTQPAFDTLLRMAYAGSPRSSRGSAPAGYAPGTPYPYERPKFGDR